MARNEQIGIQIKVLDLASAALRKMQGLFKALTRTFFNFKTAILGVAGVGGFGLLIKQSLNATDALAKTASKIGTTTEALSALQYAGKLTGVEVNTMNMALQRFSRRASEAANGTGEAKGALRELRIDASQLVRLPLDQQMLALADAFENAKTRGIDPLRLAFKLFDSEGTQLVNTLALGRNGLSEVLGEARALGAVMSSEAAAGVEEANDEFLKLNTIFKGIIDQTTAALAPALEYIVESLVKTLKSFGDAQTGFTEVGKTIAKSLISAFEAGARGIFNILNSIIVGINKVNSAVLEIGIKYDRVGLKALEEEKEFLEELIRIRNLSAEEQDKGLTRAEKNVLIRAKRRGIIETEAANMILGIERQLAEKREQIRESVDAKSGIPELKIEDIFGISENEFDEFFVNLNKKVGDFSLQLGKPPKGAETNMVNKYLEQLRALDTKLPQSEDLVVSFANNTMNAFTAGFTNAITGAEKFSDAIRNMAKSVIDDLIRMAVQYYITQKIFGAIVGAFGGDAGASAGAGAGSGGGTFTGMSFNGGGFTGYGARAGGVDGKGGFPAILHPNESVIDHTRGQGAGVTIVQNINVTTGVQQTVRAEIANLLPQISNAAKAAVADSRMRGGGFSKAMVGA